MGISPELADFIKRNFPEYADLGEEELIMIQESFFGNENLGGGGGRYEADFLASDEALARALHDELSNLDFGYHDDEALARALQAEMGREESYGAPSSTHTARSTGTRQDDIDPDRMSYEELSNLGDSVGTEKKGLTVETMSQLQPFTFKGSAPGRNKDAQECIVCCSKFEKGDRVIALPCLHQYHADCITKWLEDHKKCPVCKKGIEQ